MIEVKERTKNFEGGSSVLPEGGEDKHKGESDAAVSSFSLKH
jgi:hypothetical protein